MIQEILLLDIILNQISEQTILLKELSSFEVPFWQYELHALRQRQEEEFLPQDCPSIQEGYSINKIYINRAILYNFDFFKASHISGTTRQEGYLANLEVSSDYFHLGCWLFNIKSPENLG